MLFCAFTDACFRDYILFADGEVDWETKVLLRHKTVRCPTPNCTFQGPLHAYAKQHCHGRAAYNNKDIVRCCVDRLRFVVHDFVDSSDSAFYRKSPISAVVETVRNLPYLQSVKFAVCYMCQQYHTTFFVQRHKRKIDEQNETDGANNILTK